MSASGSSNHWNHAVHVFGVPNDYEPPIRNVLASLHAGLPVSDGRLELFSLACAVTAIQPNNGKKVTQPETSGKQPRAHRTQIERDEALFDLEGTTK